MKKDKSVLIANPSENYEAKSSSSSSNKQLFPDEYDEEDNQQQINNDFPLRTGTRNGSSKYDFVKVLFILSVNSFLFHIM